LSFIVGRIVIEGAFPELEIETRPLVGALEGQRITVTQIFEFANAVEQAYARSGFVLVRVTVPPQTLTDSGTLRIVVTDGFIERVQVENVPDRVRGVVTSRVNSLVGQRHLKLGEIERRLLTAGDLPGLHLKSTLTRGETLGGVLLLLEGTHRMAIATATIDNRLPASLGTWSYGGSMQLNSPFGFGEQFYASAEASGEPEQVFASSSPYYVLGAGAVVPLGFDGWMINPEYTYSRSEPEPESGLVTNGYFERIAVRTWYPLIRTRSKIFTLNGAFEHISQKVSLPLFATDLNSDLYSVARFGVDFETGLPLWNAALRASAAISQGLGGRDEADAAASSVPLSRQGASPRFTKAVAEALLGVPLPKGFRIDLEGRFQTAFGEPLMTSEQFALDGPQAISAFASGALSVDAGATLRAELSRPFAAPGFGLPLVLSPYGFGAVGVGHLEEPTAVEVVALQAGALGLGVRGALDLPGGWNSLAFALEVARQFSNIPDHKDGWRTNFNARVSF
jgi:hemolysin activation/secretion protein